MRQITCVLALARSLYAHQIDRHDETRLPKPDIQEISELPVDCEEFNDIYANTLGVETTPNPLDDIISRNYSEIILDMVANDSGALVLNSSVEELVNQGPDLSDRNQIGQNFLEGFLDKP